MRQIFNKKAYFVFFALMFNVAAAFAAAITVNGASANNGVYTATGNTFTISYNGSNGLAQLTRPAGAQINGSDVLSSYSGSFQIVVSAPGTYNFKLQSSIQPGISAGTIQYFAVNVK